MGLGKHFYNHEHDNTINKAKTNQALDIIDFILQNRKYLSVAKIVEKAKYHADIEAKLKSEEQRKKRLKKVIDQPVVEEDDDEE